MIEFFKELLGFMRERKIWWLAPLILVLLLFAVVVVIGGSSAAAPFIYSLF